MNTGDGSRSPASARSGLWLLLLFVSLTVVLAVLFWRSFDFRQALFANDGPYGVLMSNLYKMPDGFFGVWNDLYWLGTTGGNFFPNPTGLLLWGLGRRMFVNFYTPCTAMMVGLAAWVFFRQLRFNNLVSVLGGIAAALNMNFFSNACWGLGTRNTSLACILLALAAVHSAQGRLGLVKIVLAGLAIGLSISEGGDNGAIFSLFVAAYAFFLTITRPGPLPAKVLAGVGRVALMAVFAGVMSYQSLMIFKSVAVSGVKEPKMEQMSRQAKWDWATQWSLPKLETLRVIVPGIYGYRLDTPDGGNYWGAVGQQPGWEQHHQGFPRHSGAGEYAGVLVVLVALWGLANACSRKGSVFDEQERRTVQFWGFAGLVALLLAWGRYAPFYQVLYAVPYFSTIRNPMKFMHPFHMTLMILFAYGLAGLSRRYLESMLSAPDTRTGRARSWWSRATPFERTWNYACLAVLGLGLVGWLVYSSAHTELAQHLSRIGFSLEQGEAIARFSSGEVFFFLLFLAASIGALFLIQSGALAGRRAPWAGLILGAILVWDLGRADRPWIQYFNIAEKYADNPVLDVLRDQPWRHRVSVPNFQNIPPQMAEAHGLLQQVYQIEWLQHHFQLFNIQAMEVAQMPRVPEDFAAFNTALAGSANMLRLWQLTNTRYLLALAGFTDAFNAQVDPQKKRFRSVLLFNIVPRPGGGITAVTNTTGPYALIEFTGALPRARLYSQWQVSTNDDATLKRLADPAFDPEQSVLVAENIPGPGPVAPNAALAPVEFSSYSPRKIGLRTEAPLSTVLLLDNRYDPNWDVQIDGKSAPLLRCNFIAQGVRVPAGRHAITFRFAPPVNGFWLMFGCVVFGLVLCVVLAVATRLGDSGRAVSAAGNTP
jgi:hypothetical protein